MKLFMLLISSTTAIAVAGPLSVSEPAATINVVNASTVVNASGPANKPGTADLCSDCKRWMHDCVEVSIPTVANITRLQLTPAQVP
ncbi:hypothetical protein K505DRAFT_322889 [Melanomma pulvis-pyrius CBS 109.77]|uniref:Uncharacterized protein n=1 Tax=Melanomma pulvis-pyrius CBS 109.77 TaxID=1314802 RepID=A0A6A6XNA2_9PLEO|nr:hypothetical protein K505DRAFT_322889 [Melanomma pulvis-pyrius CBS 109.77]